MPRINPYLYVAEFSHGVQQRNCLDREMALCIWAENTTSFTNEEGEKGRIQVGHFAELVVPDRDYFSCAENEIVDTTSLYGMVEGRIVYAAGTFAALDEGEVPPAILEIVADLKLVCDALGYACWGGMKKTNARIS